MLKPMLPSATRIRPTVERQQKWGYMVRVLGVLLGVCAATVHRQSGTTPTIAANATLILVPTEVHTRAGELIYGLNASQFRLEDNGILQTPHLDDSDTPQRLALAVVVQCSREAYREAAHIKGLATMIDDLVGAAPHTVAVVSFGNDADLLHDFTSDPAEIHGTFSQIKPCPEQDDNVTLDAVEYASQLLRKKSAANSRKVILLVSETRDHGSQTDSSDVIAELGKSNIVVESVSYGPAKSQLVDELTHQHRNVIMNGQMNLAPLFVMAGEALKQNVPHTLTQLSGGQHINFTTARGFDEGVHRLTILLHNEYRLSFQPKPPITPGIHHLSVSVPTMPDVIVRARLVYFSGTISQVD
jgi:VWFA-related protein